MDKGWTDVALVIFPWIGGGAAIVLLVLQFGTRLLQSEPGSSRWHDRTGRLSYKALAIIFFNGVFFHIILTGPLMLFISGNIGSAALVGTQLANAVLFLLIPWLGENWRGGVLIRPVT